MRGGGAGGSWSPPAGTPSGPPPVPRAPSPVLTQLFISTCKTCHLLLNVVYSVFAGIALFLWSKAGKSRHPPLTAPARAARRAPSWGEKHVCLRSPGAEGSGLALEYGTQRREPAGRGSSIPGPDAHEDPCPTAVPALPASLLRPLLPGAFPAPDAREAPGSERLLNKLGKGAGLRQTSSRLGAPPWRGYTGWFPWEPAMSHC